MNNKLIPLVITLVVGIILAGSVLMPVLNDATKTEVTYTNEGYYRMAEIGDESISIVWDHTEPTQLTVNDEVVDLSKVPKNTVTTILVTDQTIVRYAPITSDTLVQIYSSTGYVGAGVNAGTDMEITIEDTTLTAFNGTTTVTKTIAGGYYVSNDGKWIMKANGTDAFIHKDDSIIVLAGNTTVGSVAVGVYANGTINDGLDIDTVQTDSVVRTPTYGDVTFTYTDVSGAIDLVKLSDCKFTITLDDTTVNATYSYFLVPYEVTAELSQHLTPGQIALMGAIPVLVIVALLVVAVGVVARRND